MFAGIFGVLFIYFKTRNKERMALIEKGAHADLLSKKTTGLGALKIGMLLTGVALGIIFGHLMYVHGGMDEEIAMPSMIFLMGGLSLISYYLAVKKISKTGNHS